MQCLSGQETMQLTLAAEHADYKERITRSFPEPFLLESITFESDVQLQKSEFFYLTELHEGMLVTPTVLCKAVSYLRKKKKFESIIVQLSAGTYGKKLHIKLMGYWTLQALKLHGFMLGKDKYRQFYLMEPGEPFDEEKHKLSVQRLKEIFNNEGYFNNKLISKLEYDELTKSIIVHLTLRPKERFGLGNITLILHENECIDSEQAHQLEQDVYKRFFNRMSKNKYTKEYINKETRSLKRFLAARGFLHVPIELQEQVDLDRSKVDLTFSLELHRKKEFIFKGNEFFTDTQLLDALLLFGQAAWLLPGTILQQELEQVYRKKGFWNVAITAHEACDSYTFTISEGSRAIVKKVTLKRVANFDPVKLAKTHFSHCIKQKEFDDEQLTKATDALLNWYVEQGFLDAKIIKQEFIPLDHQNFELVLFIDEGDRTNLTSITIEPLKELEDLGPFLTFKQQKSPVPFFMKEIQEQRKWLNDYLEKKGHKHAQITPEFKRDGTSMALTWKIVTNEMRGKFGKTIMLGSNTFPFEYVMRELQYKEGDPWDQTKIKNSLLRLRRLDVFDTINLNPYEMIQTDADQALMLKLLKEDPFELRTRAGFAIQQMNKQLKNAGLTYRVGGTFYIKNPFNVADLFNIDADFTRSQRTFVVQYMRPWIFDCPIRTMIQGYNNMYQQPGLINRKENLYEVTNQGALVHFMRGFPNIDTGIKIGIDLAKTLMRNEDMPVPDRFARKVARAINFEPELLNKKIPYVLIEPSLVMDYVDNKLQPRQGGFTLLTIKSMIPFDSRIGRKSIFTRLLAEQSWFIPFWRAVLGLRIRFGHIWYKKLSHVLPSERFYLGGANSIRSYETDRCPPLGRLESDDGCCVQFVQQGGKSMVNFNGELRFPLFSKMDGVLFQDLGALDGETIFQSCTLKSVLAGTGFGIRYYTPLGPIRFDVAWKWKRSNPEELRYAWFLTIGQAF